MASAGNLLGKMTCTSVSMIRKIVTYINEVVIYGEKRVR